MSIDQETNDPSVLSGVDLEILRVRLTSVVEELAVTLANAAPTREVSQARDFAVALVDPSGGIAATDNILALGSLSATVAHVLSYFEFDLKDGDVIVTNDPYGGGTCVQDLTLLTPYVVDGNTVAHVLARVRLPDVGGKVGGNLHPAATEVWAEGVVVPPVKIQRQHRPARDVVTTLLLNGRRPHEARQLVDVARAVLGMGLDRMGDLVDHHGLELTRAALARAQDYSEQLTRAAVESWSDGSFDGVASLGSGAGEDEVAVRVTAVVAGDSLTLDLSASDAQQPSFVNCAAGASAAFAVLPVLALLGDRVPANAGVLRALTLRTRAGTVTHPVRPAPVGWGSASSGTKVAEAVATALSQAARGSLAPLVAARPLALTRSVGDRSRQVDLAQWLVPAASASRSADGWGQPPFATRPTLASVEQWEGETGMRIRRLEYLPDSADPGQWQGAPAVEVEIDLPADNVYTLWAERDGRAGTIAYRAGGDWVSHGGVITEQPLAADRVRLSLPGGRGVGSPADRDRRSVRDDLADGLLSRAAAAEIYQLSTDEPSAGASAAATEVAGR